MNQFATPGLGSLLAHRFVAGAGQLGVFLAGFLLFVVWFFDEMRKYYDLMFSDNDPHIRMWPLWAGLALCVCGWLWSLVTSISLMREAKRNEQASVQQSAARTAAAPPVIK